MKIIIVSNNSDILELKNTNTKVLYNDCNLLEILIIVRDYIHKGHKLLSHPLSGSIKPNETPYKSVIISHNVYNKIDEDAVIIIENSINTVKKFPQKKIELSPKILEDFRLIDKSLIDSALLSNNIL